jgi:hypothetical protein
MLSDEEFEILRENIYRVVNREVDGVGYDTLPGMTVERCKGPGPTGIYMYLSHLYLNLEPEEEDV